MLAIARAMAVLCAWIGRVVTRRSDALEKLSASEPLPSRLPQPSQVTDRRLALQEPVASRNHAQGRLPVKFKTGRKT